VLVKGRHCTNQKDVQHRSVTNMHKSACIEKSYFSRDSVVLLYNATLVLTQSAKDNADILLVYVEDPHPKVK